MKSRLFAWSVTSLLFLVYSAQGEDFSLPSNTCWLEVRVRSYTPSPRNIEYQDHDGETVITQTLDSWEACYQQAISLAKSKPEWTEASIRVGKAGGKTLPGRRYISWNFRDGFFSNSKGLVSTYSSLDAPALGDVRADENGDYLSSIGNCMFGLGYFADGTEYIDTGSVRTAQVRDAKSCYAHTVHRLNNLPEEKTIPVVSGRHKGLPGTGTRSTVMAKVFGVWEFNDGYLDDSDGTVTRHSDPESFVVGANRRDSKGLLF